MPELSNAWKTMVCYGDTPCAAYTAEMASKPICQVD
jgi:hypothetical protein